MTSSELIDAFYEGATVHAVVAMADGQLTTVEFEWLLRGYLIGLRMHTIDSAPQGELL